jgi:hypothetical protein
MADPILSPAGARDSTVMVGCKHPNGVVLNLDKLEPVGTQGQVRIVKHKVTVTLKGWAHRFNQPDPAEGLGGYVLTAVPRDFWEEWVKTHDDFPMLLDKTILGPPSSPDAAGQARAHDDIPKMHAMSKQETVLLDRSRLTTADR